MKLKLSSNAIQPASQALIVVNIYSSLSTIHPISAKFQPYERSWARKLKFRRNLTCTNHFINCAAIVGQITKLNSA